MRKLCKQTGSLQQHLGQDLSGPFQSDLVSKAGVEDYYDFYFFHLGLEVCFPLTKFGRNIILVDFVQKASSG